MRILIILSSYPKSLILVENSVLWVRWGLGSKSIIEIIELSIGNAKYNVYNIRRIARSDIYIYIPSQFLKEISKEKTY